VKTLSQIIHHIQSLRELKDFVLIAVDGRGGSGKTTTALQIKHEIPDAEVITTDDFLNDEVHKIDINQLELQVLIPFSKGKSASYQEYDGKETKERVVQPKGVVIIEGIYSSHSSLRKYYDLTIWVNAPDVDDRVTKRDGLYDNDWHKYHRPNEDAYIEQDKPEERADYIIVNKENEALSDLGKLWEEFAG
jgi:uridine kinase